MFRLLMAVLLLGAPDGGTPCTKHCRNAGVGECGADYLMPVPCPETATAPALDQLKGFQKAEWGMTPAEVSKLFPGGRTSGDRNKRTTLALKREVAGLAAQLAFVFDGGKRLVEVRVGFDNQQRGYADWRQVCSAVTKALTERYGDGDQSEEVIQSYSVRWSGHSTLLQLDCAGIAIWPKTSVALFYTERAFEESQPQVKSDEL